MVSSLAVYAILRRFNSDLLNTGGIQPDRSVPFRTGTIWLYHNFIYRQTGNTVSRQEQEDFNSSAVYYLQVISSLFDSGREKDGYILTMYHWLQVSSRESMPFQSGGKLWHLVKQNIRGGILSDT